MRKIFASEMVTLDGYFADPNGGIDWFYWNEEMAKSAIELINTVDMLLFGRVTYDLMADYWPKASPPTEDPIIIENMNDLPKIVFSKTLEKAVWKNTKLIKEIDAQEIMNMKQQPDKDMVIYGSGSIVTALMNLDLIDEYYLLVNPVVLGSGKPLFKDLKSKHKLKLVGTKTFSNNVVQLRYASESPGGE